MSARYASTTAAAGRVLARQAYVVSVCLACEVPYWVEPDKCASCSGLGRMYGPTWEERDSWQCHTCDGFGLAHGADKLSHGLCSDACKADYRARIEA